MKNRNTSMERVSEMFGRDMSPEGMQDRLTQYQDLEREYGKAMEPYNLESRAREQAQFETGHTVANTFGGDNLRMAAPEKSPAEKLGELRQEREDALKTLQEDAEFVKGVVQNHREYFGLNGNLNEPGNSLEQADQLDRSRQMNSREPSEAVRNLLAETAPKSRHGNERADDRSDSRSSGGGSNGGGAPSLRSSLARATGRARDE